MSSSPRASSRCRIRASSRASPRRRNRSPSRRWPSASAPWPRRSCRTPPWKASPPDSAWPASTPRPTTAGRLGITPAAIDTALYNAFGQRLISTIFTQSNQYRVVLEVKPEFRRGPDALKDITVASSSGAQVPLSALTTVTEKPALLAVNHLGQFPAATISFNLAPGASLGAAVSAIEAQALDLPESVRTGFQGAALAFRASLANELLLILAAIVTMYKI